MARVLVDANAWVYAVDGSEPSERVASSQVLSEDLASGARDGSVRVVTRSSDPFRAGNDA